jgi:hypothetical protein
MLLNTQADRIGARQGCGDKAAPVGAAVRMDV